MVRYARKGRAPHHEDEAHSQSDLHDPMPYPWKKPETDRSAPGLNFGNAAADYGLFHTPQARGFSSGQAS
jgi:hypothetical protein